jgi:superfamily II DNA or RNA helicase
VVCVPASSLRPLGEDVSPDLEKWRIAYIAAAAKVAEVLEGFASGATAPVLLAPMESNVIPLPHQIHALERAIARNRVRYLLADEVGLGKTIEAGLVMRELKLRGLVRRTLIVSPKGLASQWAAEMQTHFSERFQLILGEDIAAMRRLLAPPEPGNSAWTALQQAIVTLDAVKPLERRNGWSPARIAEYNRLRFEDLMTAGWDLVIVDEAHRLGGSTNQVARYKLGKGLAQAAPYLLLLSATPHQGKSDAFYRLMNLLDDKAFPDANSVSRDRIAPYVIRTEKRKAIDAEGKPLFKPRSTQMVAAVWESRHHLQQALYEAVSAYVREGYNQALREKKRHIGFLMLLIQRLVVSSTHAIRLTLERRLAVLKDRAEQAELFLTDTGSAEDDAALEELYDMDGQELVEALLCSRTALKNEKAMVAALLDAAIHCEQAGDDAKAEALLEKIYALQAEEDDPDLKILIFSEFVPTQAMLKEFLEARGIAVSILNGSMNMDERRLAQEEFRASSRVLVSTDAGGEGLNLQFAHVVVNYDIPWNPMRLEQRIGRVDRIGQSKPVKALNFILEDTVESRVLEVLETKLSVIMREFGVDKTGDVLDSAQAGALFEDVYAAAIGDPSSIEASAEQAMTRMRDEILSMRASSAVYGISEEPDLHMAERLRSHPLPFWLERMTLAYLNAHGGKATHRKSGWDLHWPDGHAEQHCVFSAKEMTSAAGFTLLNLENAHIRGLAMNLPQLASGQPVPCVTMENLPAGLSGSWGLFEIALLLGTPHKTKLLRIPTVRCGYISIFLDEENNVFLQTARHIWDELQTDGYVIQNILSQKESLPIYERLLQAAESAGQSLFETMKHVHLSAVQNEEERGETALASHREAVAHIGLPEVRQYRLANCSAEETAWREELRAARQVVPELRALAILKIQSGGGQ